ncbi:unnamed protein product [Callosobruchus maculatus]|uniref:Uncharacterized protein n=1 Tax=Callosobruchus maculatus TaxID=64391 RepID=A0A653CG85_CALMS|nr:unnamed protein product [Callosobruchus maculatus]
MGAGSYETTVSCYMDDSNSDSGDNVDKDGGHIRVLKKIDNHQAKRIKGGETSSSTMTSVTAGTAATAAATTASTSATAAAVVDSVNGAIIDLDYEFGVEK